MAMSRSFRKNPETPFKLLSALLIITFFLLIKQFSAPSKPPPRITPDHGAHIQFAFPKNETLKGDVDRADKIRDAMKWTFWRYREVAWGADDVRPVTGGNSTSRNGWGAFIVDASTTLAVMGLWEELALSVSHILSINFEEADGLVDPFETTIRYLGGLVSLVDLVDAGIVPSSVVNATMRDGILAQAVRVAEKLGSAYTTPTGLPWTRVNFTTDEGLPDPPPDGELDKPRPNQSIGLARAGSSILENRVLTRLTGDGVYATNSTRAWSSLVWSKYLSPWPGMPNSPIDIITGAPTGRQRHWDAGQDSYYEYLLKITLLAPPSDPYMETYKSRFLEAAYSLRSHLASRSAPAKEHKMQHLFIGRQDAKFFINLQSHLACFAPGTILLGSAFLDQPYLRTFALALLEGCRHAYSSSSTGIAPEKWAWKPKLGYHDPIYSPSNPRELSEQEKTGIWSIDPVYKLRPEYVESLFYAWRITGQERYRVWAWEAWTAIENNCKVEFGFAGLRDVGKKDAEWRFIDHQESFFAAETLKYLWLTFAGTEVASLDRWVFSTEGHLFRMIR